MTIKSDRWIKEQCLTPTNLVDEDWQPMIHPFVPNQVKTVERKLDLLPGAFTSASLKPAVLPPGVVEKKDGYYRNDKIVSYGTSSFGYDVRLADEFKIFTNINGGIIDPLNMEEKYYHQHKGDKCIIPPNSYVLGHTIERFKIPRDVMVICVGKSTYARCGAIVNVTPIEAGFEGQVVIEISNATNLPLVVHANQGIAQFMFFQSDEACEVSYADRGGKYQGQAGIQTALV